ncbi:response regulator [Algoriphagus aquimarinus]|uniref:DNA-binding response regulator, NarL/FixJ family, contains REC and HTH domains n=1 Tax=Algoriphagus aquimarinus TaxID=237018 RepID=A0A1I1B5W4_9BACT|nr:response regulator [Algoriphagus aquimarinus]SFB43933.1 DNA-binding response regulator, NarL/FixJ family, contains REC and HTH domains [Algoriphagus aquimarinus]
MKSKKVLIVENNDLTRTLFENLIGQLFSFESVKNGIDAVERASKEKFDLILMDIQMPSMDGITAAKIIWKQSTYQCKIIALSTYSAESAKSCLLEMGFDDFIPKPIRPKEFLEVITAKLNSKIENTQATDGNLILDKEVLLQLLKYNSTDNIKSIYGDLLAEFDELMEQVDSAFKEKDQQTVIENLHTIKGNSGTLGANAIFVLSTDADRMARSQDWDSLEKALIKLRKERKILEKYIKEETTFKL